MNTGRGGVAGIEVRRPRAASHPGSPAPISTLGLRVGQGFSIGMAAHAFAVLDSYVYGFAVQEASLTSNGPCMEFRAALGITPYHPGLPGAGIWIRSRGREEAPSPRGEPRDRPSWRKSE
jgi:hypothetical protein